MGGWYDQPDCLVPSGESFLRQISLGREYFQEKFGVKPTAALNFDSFGHTRGLVEILTKCGYDSYTFCRPSPDIDPIVHGPFLWKGYDGSTIKALRYEGPNIYCSTLGFAGRDIRKKIEAYSDQNNILVLWGVGNHGGIESASDLEQISSIQKEKSDAMDIRHSTLEDYFSSVSPTETVGRQFLALRKSYSSASDIKRAHDELENQIIFSETLGAMADLAGSYHYDRDVYLSAEKSLAEIEFHDVLSGTAIKRGTKEAIAKASGATISLKNESFKAFSSMAEHLPPALPNDSEVVIYNPHPYECRAYVETEILAVYPNEKEEDTYHFTLMDENGNEIPNQIITEDSNINFDRRKRLLYELTLGPASVSAVSVHYEVKPNEKKHPISKDGDIVIADASKTVKISRKTGALYSLLVDGKERLSNPSFLPFRFDDNEDPWGWGVKKLGSNFTAFRLDNDRSGVFEGLKGVDTIEEGPLLSSVQSLYSLGESHVVITYKIYKDTDYVDVDVHVLWNETKKGLKLSLSPKGDDEYFAQMAFGVERYRNDGEEYPANRYVGVKEGETATVIYNKGGIHSVSRRGDELSLTLLNGSAYCAHPSFIEGRPIIPNQRKFVDFIEQGPHDFSLRLGVNKTNECEKRAGEFSCPPYSLEFFPHGEKKNISGLVALSNPNIVMSAFKKLQKGDYLLRLYNGSEVEESSLVAIGGTQKEISLKPFEFSSFAYDGKTIEEIADNGVF